MYYETESAELFLLDVGDYLEETTVMKNYVAMPADKKAKYVERVIITVTKRCSPKSNYGISRDVLRAFIVGVLADMERKFQ